MVTGSPDTQRPLAPSEPWCMRFGGIGLRVDKEAAVSLVATVNYSAVDSDEVHGKSQSDVPNTPSGEDDNGISPKEGS